MNNALDSPLEALAINYISFGFLTAVNNIWTWVAVIAGAVSFLVSIRKPVKPLTDPVQPDQKTHERVCSTCSPTTSAHVPQTLKISPTHFSSQDAMVGPTRGKFTVYYEDDVAEEEEDDVDVCHVVEREGCGWEWEWEGMRRMRILTGEEIGWYRHQDLKAIDGNVVRLWDGCRGVSTSSSNFVPVTW